MTKEHGGPSTSGVCCSRYKGVLLKKVCVSGAKESDVENAKKKVNEFSFLAQR